MTITPDGIPTQEPDYRLEMLDGEALLFHPAQGSLVHCNQMGAVIWHLCNGERTVEEIISLLAEAYPEAEPEVARDVQRTLGQFLEAHAIRMG